MCGPGEITWVGEGIVHSLLITEGKCGELGPQPRPQLLSGTRTQGVAAEQRQVPWARPAHLWGFQLRGSSRVSTTVSIHCPETSPGPAAKGSRAAMWETLGPQDSSQYPRTLASSAHGCSGAQGSPGMPLGRGCGHLLDCSALKPPRSRGQPCSSPGWLDFLQTPTSNFPF